MADELADLLAFANPSIAREYVRFLWQSSAFDGMPEEERSEILTNELFTDRSEF